MLHDWFSRVFPPRANGLAKDSSQRLVGMRNQLVNKSLFTFLHRIKIA